jgi:biofilm PGA synthesis N-glycosyltransferase PgaC
MENKYTYVLITPARNEGSLINKTIESVISQTMLPKVWVIVSDNSDDGTDNIVAEYAESHEWIIYLRAGSNITKAFESKVFPFDVGLDYIVKHGIKYDIIGCLDADITFDESYFEYLVAKFEDIPLLGVAGTDFVEGALHSYKHTYASPLHVNGQCQLFRKQCFEEIGGYVPIPFHGEDWYAVMMARYKGWETQSFHDKVFTHFRTMGTKGRNILSARFIHGQKDYILGNSFYWELLRFVFQMKKKPFLLSGLMIISGYIWCFINRQPKAISPELLAFIRAENAQRSPFLYRRILTAHSLRDLRRITDR